MDLLGKQADSRRLCGTKEYELGEEKTEYEEILRRSIRFARESSRHLLAD